MKKYILYALLILVHSSCSKEFTELTPISERNIQSAYKTEADFAVAITSSILRIIHAASADEDTICENAVKLSNNMIQELIKYKDVQQS